MAQDGFGFLDVAGFVSDEVFEGDLECDVSEVFGVLDSLGVAADGLALQFQNSFQHGAVAIRQRDIGRDGRRLTAERDNLIGEVGGVNLVRRSPRP